MNKQSGIFILIFLSVFMISIVSADTQTITLISGNSTMVSLGGVMHTISLTSITSTQAQITIDNASVITTLGKTQQINGLNVSLTSFYPNSGNISGSGTISIQYIASNITVNNSSTQVVITNTPNITANQTSQNTLSNNTLTNQTIISNSWIYYLIGILIIITIIIFFVIRRNRKRF